MALAFVVHLLGDLHQPLHVGEHDDRGGNQVNARYGVIGGELNLHSIWDGLSPSAASRQPPGGPRGILSADLAPRARRHAAGQRRGLGARSWQVSHDDVYGRSSPIPAAGKHEAPVTVDEAMTQKLIPAVRLQIARGGLRLAKLLNEALG